MDYVGTVQTINIIRSLVFRVWVSRACKLGFEPLLLLTGPFVEAADNKSVLEHGPKGIGRLCRLSDASMLVTVLSRLAAFRQHAFKPQVRCSTVTCPGHCGHVSWSIQDLQGVRHTV